MCDLRITFKRFRQRFSCCHVPMMFRRHFLHYLPILPKIKISLSLMLFSTIFPSTRGFPGPKFPLCQHVPVFFPFLSSCPFWADCYNSKWSGARIVLQPQGQSAESGSYLCSQTLLALKIGLHPKWPLGKAVGNGYYEHQLLNPTGPAQRSEPWHTAVIKMVPVGVVTSQLTLLWWCLDAGISLGQKLSQ